MKVKDFYDGIAESYRGIYEGDIHDTNRKYPANYFRLQMLINKISDGGFENIFEVGVGDGMLLSVFAEMGLEVYGIDVSSNMANAAKNNLQQYNVNESSIICADIEVPSSYNQISNKKFDVILAMGVMPHIQKDDFVISNMSKLLKHNGKIYVEFRNKLFSLFTFNDNTADFVANDLLKYVDEDLKKCVKSKILSLMNNNISKPTYEGYDNIQAKFHNPLEINGLFERNGFGNINVIWYHYHSSPPFMAKENEQRFRDESIKLEHRIPDWRDPFLCSAFVVEATKI